MNPYVSAYKKSAEELKARSRRRMFSTGALAAFLLIVLSFVTVYKQTVAQQMMIEVQTLNAQRKKLLTERSVLLSSRQAALSRERIVSFARENLALDFPSPENVRWIRVHEELVRPKN